MQRAHDETWHRDMNQEVLGGASDVDFTKFLELGNDFAQFDGEQHNLQIPSGLDTTMGRLSFAQDGQVPTFPPAQQQAILHNIELNMGGPPHMAFGHLQQQQQQVQSQQFQQFQAYQQMQSPYRHHVPPTPVSSEMQAAKYASAMDSGQIVFDRQNASFTPLVSPAQTPIDNPWGMPDYVITDDFFSPLTSPAIEAQQHFSTNTTSSPVDLNVEQQNKARKTRRKLNPVSQKVSRPARPSPAIKPASSRRQISLSSPAQDRGLKDGDHPKHLFPGSSHSTASENSVSPEPLSESLMRPPPVPQSRTPNVLRGQSQSGNVPATPATIMKMPGDQNELVRTDGRMLEPPEVMQDISLPAAAADMPSRILPEINTSLSHIDDQDTPTTSAKTPKLTADSTPRSIGAKTANNSQEILPKASRGGRRSKRQSISQATVSPALAPKISPSINPRVSTPGSGMSVLSAETSALYLASKSNYQNIIDGTHLPGVSYPETLAENLSSKRTSHKIAEQGRRNRMNVALKEIEFLLPASITSTPKKDKNAAKEEAGDSDKPGAQGASKASTVEMAIVYIKSLQTELQETKEKLEAAEKSFGEGSSDGSQISDQTNA